MNTFKIESLLSVQPERDLDIHFCWGETSTESTIKSIIESRPDSVFAIRKAADRHKIAFRFNLHPENFAFIRKDIVPEGNTTLVLFDFEEINLLSSMKAINYTNWKKIIIIYNLYEDVTDD